MELSNYTEYIQKKMHEKGINIETQDYVIKYVYMNEKLFKNCLNIDKIVDRILNNLNHSIDMLSIDKSKNPFKEFIRVSTIRGRWEPYNNKILINPINKLKSNLFQREKQKNDSTIMHEIDHCATTEYIDISEQEKELYIQNYIEKNNIKDSKTINIIREDINEMYARCNGVLEISGIQDFRQVLVNGIDLKKLNEGITAYKQERYDRFLGNKPYTNYKIEKKAAKFIGSVIGEEKLISMHFNNDYEGIRAAFKEKTGEELNDLVDKLNKKSKTMTMIFGKMYTRYFSKKIEKFMGKYKISDLKEKEYSQIKEKDFREGLAKDSPSLEEQALNSKRYQEKSEEIDKKLMVADREYNE